jgi:hypothetical protein
MFKFFAIDCNVMFSYIDPMLSLTRGKKRLVSPSFIDPNRH